MITITDVMFQIDPHHNQIDPDREMVFLMAVISAEGGVPDLDALDRAITEAIEQLQPGEHGRPWDKRDQTSYELYTRDGMVWSHQTRTGQRMRMSPADMRNAMRTLMDQSTDQWTEYNGTHTVCARWLIEPE